MKAMAIDGSIQEFDVGEEKAKDLIAIDPESMDLQPHDLFQAGGTEDLISRIEEEARSVLPDVSTPKGRKAVASNAAKVARSKTYIDGLGKDLVARLKQQSNLIDEERRRMRSRLSDLKTEVRQPLTDFENREKDRVARLQDRVAESFAIHDTSTLEAIDAQIANITAVPIDETWAEYKYTAELAQHSALTKLTAARLEALKRIYAEEKRKAAEEKAREEREERIRAKAEADAKLAAERQANFEASMVRQETARREAEAKAAAERAIFEAQEKETQARLALAREQQAAEKEAARVKAEAQQKVRDAQEKARIAEQEWIAKAAKERAKEEAAKKNIEVQTRVLSEMAAAIRSEAEVDCGVARRVVKAMADGLIPHVTIIYL